MTNLENDIVKLKKQTDAIYIYGTAIILVAGVGQRMRNGGLPK